MDNENGHFNVGNASCIPYTEQYANYTLCKKTVFLFTGIIFSMASLLCFMEQCSSWLPPPPPPKWGELLEPACSMNTQSAVLVPYHNLNKKNNTIYFGGAIMNL